MVEHDYNLSNKGKDSKMKHAKFFNYDVEEHAANTFQSCGQVQNSSQIKEQLKESSEFTRSNKSEGRKFDSYSSTQKTDTFQSRDGQGNNLSLHKSEISQSNQGWGKQSESPPPFQKTNPSQSSDDQENNPSSKKAEISQSNQGQEKKSQNLLLLKRSSTFQLCYDALKNFHNLDPKEKRKVGNDFISLIDDNMNEASDLFFEFIELFDSDQKLSSGKEEFEQSYKGDLNTIKAQKLLPMKIQQLKSALNNFNNLPESAQKEKAQLFAEICKIDSKTAFDIVASFEEIFEKNQRLKAVKDLYWNEIKKHIKQFKVKSNYIHMETIKNIVVYKKKSDPLTDQEKPEVRNILVVGETGSGKSTLLNSMTTYLVGINLFDTVRVKTIVEHSRISQSHTQTLQVTEYIVKPDPTRFCYPIRFIDTPGFGDTRGLEYDDDTAKKIWEYIEKAKIKVHGICFVIKATTNRMTSIHQYIIQKILGLFGKDVKENFIGMITFADNQTTLAVKAIKDAEVPVKNIFRFNNSAFFPSKTADDDLKLTQLYWEMSFQSFKDFFDYLLKIKPVTLEPPKQVIKNNEKLKEKIKEIQDKISEGIKERKNYEQKTASITKNLEVVEHTKQYTYEHDDTQTSLRNNLPCQYTFYCINCHYMACQQNVDKMKEDQLNNSVLKDGNCNECPWKCSWRSHEKLGYYYENVPKKEKATKIFKGAKRIKSVSDLLNILETKTKLVTDTIINNIQECLHYLNLLNPESPQIIKADVADYLNMMSQVENHERKEGFTDRIRQINSIRDHYNLFFSKSSNDFKDQHKSESFKLSSSKVQSQGTYPSYPNNSKAPFQGSYPYYSSGY